LRFTFFPEGGSGKTVQLPGAMIGKTRHELASSGRPRQRVSSTGRPTAHLPFKDLLCRERLGLGNRQWRPMFDAQGIFVGYRGVAGHHRKTGRAGGATARPVSVRSPAVQRWYREQDRCSASRRSPAHPGTQS
jgi:hypothetical protein